MDKKSSGLSAAVENYHGQTDICPIMSIGQQEPVLCTRSCAWLDTESNECALSRITANTKWLAKIAGYDENIRVVKRKDTE